MIQGKRDSKEIFTTEGELSSKGTTILQHLWSNNASTNRSTQTKDLPHNPLRVHEPLAIEFRPTGKVARYNPFEDKIEPIFKRSLTEEMEK
jgi:hypothetical protein